MRKQLISFAFAMAFSALAARADIVLSVVVDTHTLAGVNGNVDFQFNPGPLSAQSATLDIKNFAGATYLAGSQVDTGGASGGPLPGTVVLTNSTVYNDDFEGVKFGNTMTFTLDFTGSAINSPTGTFSSGSSFAFSLFDSTGNNPLLTNDPNGFAAIVNVNRNGSLTATTPSSSVTILPEPSSWMMMIGGSLLALGGLYRRKR